MYRHLLPDAFEFYFEFSSPHILRQCGRYHIILYVIFRPAYQIDIPDDTGHPEFVLIFQVRTVTPLENKDRQYVLPLF